MHPLVDKLRAFPHRANGSEYQQAVVSMLKESLKSIGTTAQIRDFKAPKSYSVIVGWGVLGLAILLVLAPVFRYIDLVFLLIWVVSIYNFINGKAALFTKLPPLVSVQNIIGHHGKIFSKAKIILLAHYDTATVGFTKAKHTRYWLIVFLVLMGLAVATAINEVLFPNQDYLFWIKHVLILYFLIQAVVVSVRSSGMKEKNQDAIGLVAAFETFKYLKNSNLENIEVEIVFTGASQVGAVGAYFYSESNRAQMVNQPTFLINFDDIGLGNLKIVTQTGIVENYVYDNLLTNTAKQLVTSDVRFKNVAVGLVNTLNSETVWFHQIGIPCLTLTNTGQIELDSSSANSHVETSARQATELALETLRLSLLSLKI